MVGALLDISSQLLIIMFIKRESSNPINTFCFWFGLVTPTKVLIPSIFFRWLQKSLELFSECNSLDEQLFLVVVALIISTMVLQLRGLLTAEMAVG
jgi:hypothetical protein